MTSIDWIVIAAAASTILWINWYFLADRTGAGVMAMAADSAVPTPSATPGAAGAASAGAGSAGAGSTGATTAQATIIVQGGYEPSVVRVKAGQPVRLIFDRQETSGCSEEVVFADFGIRRFLPANQQTVIEVTPPKAGVYGFTCGMGMLRGKLVAE
jgi:plastocyanin